MSARCPCFRYTNCDVDKGFVPNKPRQPNANPFGVSFVSLRWRCDENRLRRLEHALRSRRNVCNLGGRRSKETGVRRSDRADASQGLRLEHSGLREKGWQAFEGYNASYFWDDIAKENVGLYRTPKSHRRGDD
jgi:hypothetical protein